MEIIRINTYTDDRFSREALLQHGCFLADNTPYEIKIISDYEAVIWGQNRDVYPEVIEEFRFYTPHIARFYDCCGHVVKEYPKALLLTLTLDQIQPSQFYVDKEKISAVSSFIHEPDDIIIQVLPFEERYISLDGHTRLYYAVVNGWNSVRAILAESDEYIYGFAEEAKRRNIIFPRDMLAVSHNEYEEKWIHFCDEYFAGERE